MTQGTRAAFLGAALAAAVAAATARAQPFTEHLDPIQAAAAERLAVFPDPQTPAEFAQRRALERCIRSYERNSTSPDRDLATLGALANTLDRAFPGDPEFGLALDDALDAFRSPIGDARDRIAAFIEARISPLDPRYDRALAALGVLDGHLERVDAATTRRESAAALRRARKASTAAWNRALGLDGKFGRKLFDKVGAGEFTALVDGAPFDGQAMFAGYFLRSNGVLGIEGVEFFDPVPDRARSISVLVQGVYGPGTYPVDQVLGVPAGEYRELQTVSPLVSEGDYTTAGPATPYTGTITVTTFDLQRKLVEGTFSFTGFSAAASPGDETRAITSGTFRSQLRLLR